MKFKKIIQSGETETKKKSGEKFTLPTHGCTLRNRLACHQTACNVTAVTYLAIQAYDHWMKRKFIESCYTISNSNLYNQAIEISRILTPIIKEINSNIKY